MPCGVVFGMYVCTCVTRLDVGDLYYKFKTERGDDHLQVFSILATCIRA